MPTVQQLEKEVSGLKNEQLQEFRAWFEEFDADAWDKQFEDDVREGRLDNIANSAISDFKKGHFKKL